MSTSALTILAMPKAFRGHIGAIQRNAITSWTRLKPRPDIYLCGDEEGVAGIATELGLGLLRDVARNAHGTLLLNDLLCQARGRCRTPLLCYVNCDIVLLQEFLEAAQAVTERFPKSLVVARRLNLDLDAAIDFSTPWEQWFREYVLRSGKTGDHMSIDVFVFPPDLYAEMPPLVLGRGWFDQYLIKAARQGGFSVVDITQVAQAIHQNHDYAHIAGGQHGAYWGEEAQHNLVLYGGMPNAFTLLDVTHELFPGGKIRRVPFRRQLHAANRRLWKHIVQRTRPLRERLGLRRETLRRLAGKGASRSGAEDS
jgi:hypothetical protein